MPISGQPASGAFLKPTRAPLAKRKSFAGEFTVSTPTTEAPVTARAVSHRLCSDDWGRGASVGNVACRLGGGRLSYALRRAGLDVTRFGPIHAAGWPAKTMRGKNMQMPFWAIIVGAIAGFIARWISPSPNNPQGFILTTVLGIVGSGPATFLGRAIHLYGPDQGAGIIASIIGALIVLWGWHQMAEQLLSTGRLDQWAFGPGAMCSANETATSIAKGLPKRSAQKSNVVSSAPYRWRCGE